MVSVVAAAAAAAIVVVAVVVSTTMISFRFRSISFCLIAKPFGSYKTQTLSAAAASSSSVL